MIASVKAGIAGEIEEEIHSRLDEMELTLSASTDCGHACPLVDLHTIEFHVKNIYGHLP